MRHSSTKMGKPCRSSTICLFLLVSLVNALDYNNVTITETSTKSTTDSISEMTAGSTSELTTGLTSELTTGSTSELTTGSVIDTTSATTSIAGSTIVGLQSEFTTLTETKTTIINGIQPSGNPSLKNKRKYRVAIIINPLEKNTKRAASGQKPRMKKKASHLLYEEYNADGTIAVSYKMKNMDDVATFFNVYYETEICHVVCDEKTD